MSDLDQDLVRIATTAVDDRERAGSELADWFGRTPSPAGADKLRRAPLAVPRLLAELMTRGGADSGEGAYWAPDFDEPGIPEPVKATIRATA